jgi:hypothetical protein
MGHPKTAAVASFEPPARWYHPDHGAPLRNKFGEPGPPVQYVEQRSGLLLVAYRELKNMHIQAQDTFPRSRKAIRSITFLNFLIFALYVIPPAHRWVDRGFLALRSIHFEEPVGYSLYIWLVGSTLAATVLLAWMIFRTRRTTSVGLPSASLRLETTLVAAWWLAALGACAYGFMLGMGG